MSRVLRAGSLFGIYDVMRTAPGDLAYAIPWAVIADLSAVAEPDRYKKALEGQGLPSLPSATAGPPRTGS